ncbi:hypothetical protein XELAEV_18018957mg [Xenopus laevis]|uniref:GAIN-B domain-containing protein n=1 Tax=Xenopus laevis TaxID=8355 RepID=A0A974DFU6_XENLA|nr:hypothetical protein XELAEV_18018957mg [Xenopus laevis]
MTPIDLYGVDPSCIHQRSTYHLLEASCQNKTKLDIENITNSASRILSDPSWSNLSSSEVSTVVNGLLETVELSALKLFSKNPSNQNFSTPEIDVATKVVQENCSFLTINVGLNSMQVSCDLLPKPEALQQLSSLSSDGAVFISYKSLHSRLSGNFLKLSEDVEENNTVVVNSEVVTGSITSQTTERLSPPVTFYLNNLQAPDSSHISLCVYWDPKLSGWSKRGCNITFANVSHTLCSCDHLSTFAVIMAPCDIKEDHHLRHISQIGLSVSLLCLFLSLLTFLLCCSLRSAHTSMLIALCWLHLSLIWSFLGPVCVFITINSTLLILTFWLLRLQLASLNTNLFILGSTWVLGFFQCGTGAIVALYLFTICNSLQGAFIFLVHCLLNHQVREEYRKVFRRLHIKKPESETVSGSTVPMTLKSATALEALKPDIVIDHPYEDQTV